MQEAANVSHSSSPQMLCDFTFARFRFEFVPRDTLIFPAYNKGRILRGAFGRLLRDIVCLSNSDDCEKCGFLEKCVYTMIFSPVVPKDSSHLSKNRNIPRGYILKPPLDKRMQYTKEEPFSFDMILVGKTIQYFPYIIIPFRELGSRGIGKDRGRFSLGSIWIKNLDNSYQIYDPREQMIRKVDATVTFDELAGKAEALNQGRVILNFLTPTSIRYNATGEKDGSRPMRQPEFHHIIKRLRDRINSLAVFYCGEELSIDFKAYGENAEKVRKVGDRTRWIESSRTSRAGHEHNLSGFVGDVTFEGELGPYLPLLVLGQYLHVGENAVFGNGWYELVG